VVVVTPGGNVRLLSTNGRALRAWTLPPPVDQVRLNGRTLAVQRGASVTLYDTRTGAATRTLPLSPDEGTPVLLDEQAGLIAYATGGAIHILRTSNGDDRALAIARAAPPLDAQLTPRGLFVVWNRMYDPRPGRLSFVPMPNLTRPPRTGRVPASGSRVSHCRLRASDDSDSAEDHRIGCGGGKPS
jgi:hypothetical protein